MDLLNPLPHLTRATGSGIAPGCIAHTPASTFTAATSLTTAAHFRPSACASR
jgi:hypothetical protein